MRDPLQVAFRVNGERLVILGWTRAILLQLAHPLIAAGVFDHSGFRESPIAAVQRLHHTTQAMLALTFGDEDRRLAAINGIRRIHTRVHGTLRDDVGPFAAGTPYSAEDPALLLWVHATLIETMVLTYEHLVGPLTPADRDDYCAVSIPSSVALGMEEARAPRNWAALQVYLQHEYASGRIAIGPQARALSDALLRTSIPAALFPARWLSALITSGLLSPGVRAGYGLPWNDARARRFQQLTALLRGARRKLPPTLALWPDARRIATSRS